MMMKTIPLHSAKNVATAEDQNRDKCLSHNYWLYTFQPNHAVTCLPSWTDSTLPTVTISVTRPLSPAALTLPLQEQIPSRVPRDQKDRTRHGAQQPHANVSRLRPNGRMHTAWSISDPAKIFVSDWKQLYRFKWQFQLTVLDWVKMSGFDSRTNPHMLWSGSTNITQSNVHHIVHI